MSPIPERNLRPFERTHQTIIQNTTGDEVHVVDSARWSLPLVQFVQGEIIWLPIKSLFEGQGAQPTWTLLPDQIEIVDPIANQLKEYFIAFTMRIIRPRGKVLLREHVSGWHLEESRAWLLRHARTAEHLSACGFHELQAVNLEQWKRQAASHPEWSHFLRIISSSRRISEPEGAHSQPTQSNQQIPSQLPHNLTTLTLTLPTENFMESDQERHWRAMDQMDVEFLGKYPVHTHRIIPYSHRGRMGAIYKRY